MTTFTGYPVNNATIRDGHPLPRKLMFIQYGTTCTAAAGNYREVAVAYIRTQVFNYNKNCDVKLDSSVDLTLLGSGRQIYAGTMTGTAAVLFNYLPIGNVPGTIAPAANTVGVRYALSHLPQARGRVLTRTPNSCLICEFRLVRNAAAMPGRFTTTATSLAESSGLPIPSAGPSRPTTSVRSIGSADATKRGRKYDEVHKEIVASGLFA